MSIDVAGIGDLTVDTLIFGISNLPGWGQESVVEGTEQRMGGGLGNFLLAAKAVGLDFIPYGPIGCDRTGEWLRAEVVQGGSSAAGIMELDESQTSQTFALIREDGERLFLTLDGALTRLGEFINQVDIGPAEVVYLTGWCLPPRVDPKACMSRFEAWKQEGKQIAVDFVWNPQSWLPKNRGKILELLQHTDYVFINHAELAALMGMDDLSEAAKALENLVPDSCRLIVKHGPKGALIKAAGIWKVVPALQVEPDDTVGAGDMFNAAFLHAHLNLQLSTEKAARFACVFAGLALARGRGQLPNSEEVVAYDDSLGLASIAK